LKRDSVKPDQKGESRQFPQSNLLNIKGGRRKRKGGGIVRPEWVS